jgi:hypothetical protein
MKTGDDKVKRKSAVREIRAVRIQAMVRSSLLKRLQDRAAMEHRTLSKMIELLLEEGVDQK